MHQRIANATFQVACGTSLGSGFSLLRDNLVVTNFHVVEEIIDFQLKRAKEDACLTCESGEQLEATLIHVEASNDFAILRVKTPLPAGREVLQPSIGFSPKRGKRVIFAGYPHGIPELLTSEGIISAPKPNGRFNIDGMINGGNSGGPIVDTETGDVIGIITQRRYVLNDESRLIDEEIKKLQNYLNQISRNATAEIMGIDFGDLSRLFSRSLQVTSEVMSMNANSGIGIGFPISPVTDAINGMPTD